MVRSLPAHLGTCPRIENLLRENHFGQIFRLNSLNMPNIRLTLIEKFDSKWLSLATISILEQAPRFTQTGGDGLDYLCVGTKNRSLRPRPSKAEQQIC